MHYFIKAFADHDSSRWYRLDNLAHFPLDQGHTTNTGSGKKGE
jgi:hypothetical protein